MHKCKKCGSEMPDTYDKCPICGVSVRIRTSADPEPKDDKNLLGDFRLLKKLGEGGMGKVYLARQLSMDRDVALKVLHKRLAKDPQFVERFNREARATGMLDHPAIVRGIAIGEERGFHYFVMEYIDGKTTEKILEQKGPFSVGDAVLIGVTIGEALSYAHSKDMVHRDVKPDNIMITRRGAIKLADLGLAKAVAEDLGLTATGSGFGTPYYMPPEQARNAKEVDHRCDIYALGVTIYHLLTGKLPFEGENTLEVMTAKEEQRHTPARRHNPEVPEILDLILDKTMAADPKNRYQNIDEVVGALKRTELAGPRLGAADKALPREVAPPRRADERKSEPELVGSDKPQLDKYFIRYKDKRGRWVKKRGDKHQIRDILRRGLVGAEVEGTKDPDEPYRPLLAFPEFADLVKSRMIKQAGDAASGSRLEDLVKAEDKRKRKKQSKRTLSKILTYGVILGVLGGGGYFAWMKYKESQNSSSTP